MRKLLKSKPYIVCSKQSYSRITLIFTAYCLLTYCQLGCSEGREQAVPVTANFQIKVVNEDFSVPVQIRITNTSEGADTYNWSFIGANPSASSDRNPGTLTYTEAGNYTIRLEASNKDGSIDSKSIDITLNAEISIGFNATILVDNFPPMEVALTNTTVGAETFSWTFEEGTPSSASEAHPNNIVFNEPGEHTITLEVSNGLETYQTTQTVTVAPHLEAAFTYEPNIEDDDFQTPVTLNLNNTSISATDYLWTFTGGSPVTSTDASPSVTFTTPGTYTLQLEATNGKATQIVSETITIVPNTNLRTFQEVPLGINTAHNNNTTGAFFSTTTREVYHKDTVSNSNGAAIDLVFFGLNQSFGFNTFVSPDAVQNYTFDVIPNATHTTFINRQESCGCSASLSVAEFDNMTDDSLLAAMTITETPEGSQDFDDAMVPRIVLFETHDGRKGAIKIKDYVDNGSNSYIVVDIKVQKQ